MRDLEPAMKAAAHRTRTRAAWPRLLFACIEKANRSQMAEGFAPFLGGDRVRAGSARSRPSSRVDPRAVELTQAKGIDRTTQLSKGRDALPQVYRG